MDMDAKKHLIQTYIDAYNNFDVDRMMSVLHENVCFENVQNGTVNAKANNRADFRSLAEQAKALFSSRKQTITNTQFDASTATIDLSYVGILACDFPNGMKAGEKVEMNGRSEFEFADNLITLVRDIS